jgi:hypothetical protein
VNVLIALVYLVEPDYILVIDTSQNVDLA